MDPSISWNRHSGADGITTFESRDIDDVSERLISITGADTRVDYFGDPKAFSMSATAVKLGCLLLSKNRVASWSATRVMGSQTHISIPITGTPLKYRCGTRSYEVIGDRAAVGRPFEEVQVDRLEGAALMLHAPIEALVERAEQLTAGSFSGSLVSQMVDRLDLRAPAGEAFARTLKTAMVEIGALNSAGLGPLAIASYEDLLTNLAAAVLFPPVTQGLDRPMRQCGPVAIRRARDFIKAHAAEPLSLSKLAADLGLPMRTLQENFRKCFGFSPRAWLLECRLENARQSLTLPDRSTSVSRVAYDCGFGDLSDFSAKYREKYGESPSETLRFAKERFL